MICSSQAPFHFLFKLICPSSNDPDPVAWPVAKSIVSNLTIVNVPVAPANRPVPFSIVATSVIRAVFGGMKTPSIPTNVPDSWSPFAAVKVNVPVDVFSGYLGCERSREPTEVGRSTLGSRVGRRRRNIGKCRERAAERQRRATSRRCLSRPRACVRGRRWRIQGLVAAGGREQTHAENDQSHRELPLVERNDADNGRGLVPAHALERRVTTAAIYRRSAPHPADRVIPVLARRGENPGQKLEHA